VAPVTSARRPSISTRGIVFARDGGGLSFR
jgi:hypothetical protein